MPETRQVAQGYASYEQQRRTIIEWLSARGFALALRAMEFAASYHTGMRKDGSPEFSHQLWQASLAIEIEDLLADLETLLVTIFLHDVVEDHRPTLRDIALIFGPDIADLIDRMSKVVDGMRKPNADYFAALANCPITSLAKAIDRAHNQDTMAGFSPDWQCAYLLETEAGILPLLRRARARFPAITTAANTLERLLLSQIAERRLQLSEMT